MTEVHAEVPHCVADLYASASWTPERIVAHRQEQECERIQQEVDRAIQAHLNGFGVTIHGTSTAKSRRGARDARERDSLIASVLMSLGFEVFYEGNPSTYSWDVRYIRVPGEDPHISDMDEP